MPKRSHSAELMQAAQEWMNKHERADNLTIHAPSGLPVSADYIWDKQRGGRRTYPARFLFVESLPEWSEVAREYIFAVSDDGATSAREEVNA